MKQEDKLSAIRAEIEKAMAQEMAAYKIACEHGLGEYSHAPSVYTRLQMLRSFIDSLQKEPVRKQSVEEAMAEVEEKAKLFTEAHKGENAEDILAEMRGEESVSDDLGKASEEYAYTNWQSDDYHNGASEGLPFDPIGHTQKSFKDGAQWQKQQMLKDAINAHVFTNGMGNKYLSPDYNENIKVDGKVKIIIIKED